MKLDFSMAKAGDKYIGTIETPKPGVYDADVWEIVKRGRVFLIGTATNSGLLSEYYLKMEQGESEQKALEEINADLEVLATDGASYMSRVKKIPRKISANRKKTRCWKGYKPVKGKRPYSKGSCRKVKRRRRSLRKNSSPYSKTIIKMLNAPIVGYSKGKVSPNRYQAALVRFGDGKLGIMIGWWNRMGEFVKTPGSWRLESLKDVGDAIAIDYGQEWAVKGMRGAVEEAQSEVRGLSANPNRQKAPRYSKTLPNKFYKIYWSHHARGDTAGLVFKGDKIMKISMSELSRFWPTNEGLKMERLHVLGPFDSWDQAFAAPQ